MLVHSFLCIAYFLYDCLVLACEYRFHATLLADLTLPFIYNSSVDTVEKINGSLATKDADKVEMFSDFNQLTLPKAM
jgi:hypothetical protein